MEYESSSNGEHTSLEHSWFLVAPTAMFLASLVFSFFTNPSTAAWMACYATSLAGAFAGIALTMAVPHLRQPRVA